MAGVALDTNILGYAAGIRGVDADNPKVDIAEALIAELQAGDGIILPAQVLLEFHHLLLRKGRQSQKEAAAIVGEYVSANRVVNITSELISDAFALAAEHRLQTFDAVILAAAAFARCDVLYSEDMQHGFLWRGVTVLNPFF